MSLNIRTGLEAFEIDGKKETFVEETIRVLLDFGKKKSDIRCVRTDCACASWEEFTKIADFTYDAGFGTHQIINENLMIIGDDWWLERHEYDGSEWWEFKRHPGIGMNGRVMTHDDIKEKE